MCDPVAVEPARLLDFVGRPSLTVVFISVHSAHTFNRSVCRYLGKEPPEEVDYGTVDFIDLVMSGGQLLPYLHEGLYSCGAPASLGVLPGYWLFRQGEVLAWDSGLPTVEDAQALVRGAFLGALWSGLTRDLTFVGRALRSAADDITGRRMGLAFHQASKGARASARRPPSTDGWSAADDLQRAYDLLGVRPDATDQQVQDAWRKRRVDFHPDRAAQDAEEFERLSRLSAEVNRAREVIKNHRARAAGRQTA
jgi:hypothetical protein